MENEQLLGDEDAYIESMKKKALAKIHMSDSHKLQSIENNQISDDHDS